MLLLLCSAGAYLWDAVSLDVLFGALMRTDVLLRMMVLVMMVMRTDDVDVMMESDGDGGQSCAEGFPEGLSEVPEEGATTTTTATANFRRPLALLLLFCFCAFVAVVVVVEDEDDLCSVCVVCGVSLQALSGHSLCFE